ncbi:hypothetical protein [Shimia sp. NS0008-38b]|uniref:hypothetical protein n=1 Tax=Shimia sp. NS0008-38b TaxID=3127653 RepID=UPI003342065A
MAFLTGRRRSVELAYPVPDPFRRPCPAYVDGVGWFSARDYINACLLRQTRSIYPFDWFGELKTHSAPICERPRG